ncbi:hypothetical protein IBTHAUMO2_890013 [Nitrosopumilaceae archaeon]|nr:hypothetical protein IBTHAUMO2_890013 [Nitrosopumilaceae archaeon]
MANRPRSRRIPHDAAVPGRFKSEKGRMAARLKLGDQGGRAGRARGITRCSCRARLPASSVKRGVPGRM